MDLLPTFPVSKWGDHREAYLLVPPFLVLKWGNHRGAVHLVPPFLVSKWGDHRGAGFHDFTTKLPTGDRYIQKLLSPASAIK